MPVTFTDRDVARVAEYLGVSRLESEANDSFRKRVARADPDLVQSIEIWTGRPWDKWTPEDQLMILQGLPK